MYCTLGVWGVFKLGCILLIEGADGRVGLAFID